MSTWYSQDTSLIAERDRKHCIRNNSCLQKLIIYLENGLKKHNELMKLYVKGQENTK